MSESSAEPVASNIVWDVIRYVIVTIFVGLLIYWYGFYTPTVYVSREQTGKTMGTGYIVKVTQFPETGDWQKIAGTIQDSLDALEQMLSADRQDSDVSRFNASSSTEDWFSVSQATAQIVHTALEISQLTEGAFDITVAPLVQHWGRGLGTGSSSRPASFEKLELVAVLLKKQTGYEKLSVRLDPPALKKAIPELTIDLSVIAKGFAADCIAELLDAHKITDYLIEVGNEVRGKGKKGNDKDWIIGIEKPLSDQFSGIQQAFPLKDRSLATSRSDVQFQEIEGRTISHRINPRSGLPIQFENSGNELASVVVLAPTCTQAAALTAAMFVFGAQKGLELANRHKIAVLFLLRNGNEIREVSSEHWGK